MLKSAQEHFYYFYHSEGSKVRKSLDCLVTNSLRMEIVLFVIVRIYSNQQKTFSEFFTPFPKSTSNFEHFEKKLTFIVYVLPELRTAKGVVR